MSILPWRWKIFKRKKKVKKSVEACMQAGPEALKTFAGPPNQVKKVKKRKGTKATADHRNVAERVNCIHLKSPCKGMNRWHCEQGNNQAQQIIDGDCDLFLGKDDNCQFHVAKFKPLTEEQIEAEIDKRHVRRAFVKRCVEVRLCPNDGHDLQHHMDNSGATEPMDWVDCPICNFKEWD